MKVSKESFVKRVPKEDTIFAHTMITHRSAEEIIAVAELCKEFFYNSECRAFIT